MSTSPLDLLMAKEAMVSTEFEDKPSRSSKWTRSAANIQARQITEEEDKPWAKWVPKDGGATGAQVSPTSHVKMSSSQKSYLKDKLREAAARKRQDNDERRETPPNTYEQGDAAGFRP